MRLLSDFEAEELLAEVLSFWFECEKRIPEGKTLEKPRFVKLAEKFSTRLPGTGPCQRGDK